jgi:predicted dehydrogenase
MELPDVELAALCTAHEETATESAREFGVGQAYHDHRRMLREADIDAVGVSVRVPSHHSLTMDALEAGKHVYTEWPLGANLGEAEEMAELARRKGVHTMVGLQGRCSPVFLRLKELIEEGFVGKVLAANLTSFGSGVLSRTSDRTWQRDKVLGATVLTIHFGHIIDSLCMCLGEFAEVTSVVTTQVGQWHETDTDEVLDVSAPDNVLLGGRLESGAVVSAHVGSIPWHGGGYRLMIYGREGTLSLEASEHPHLGAVRILGGRGGSTSLEELPVPERLAWVPETVPPGPPFNVAQMWTRFADAIRANERAEPDFDSAVDRHRLLDAIQRASDAGQRQSL